jgi:hypothetical protein
MMARMTNGFLKPLGGRITINFIKSCRRIHWFGCLYLPAFAIVLSSAFADDPQPSAAPQSMQPSLPLATVIVVRPPAWSEALREWNAYRSQEYHIVEINSGRNADEQHIAILAAARSCQPPATAVLLCGDYMRELPQPPPNGNAETGPNSDRPTATKRYEIITPGAILETSVKLGDATTPNLCTDATFGDLDHDGCPELAVGRLPAQSAEELQRMLRRSIDYEALPPGPWNDSVHVTAGVGGFGFLADAAIETVTRRFLTEGIPDHFHLHMTYASCTSTYCPNPMQLRESYIDRINQGGLFWVYIGHGAVTQLDHFQVGQEWLPIGNASDAARFQSQTRPPIAILLACFTGAFDAKPDSFSESLLRQPSGPIAVISGSRVTMPYGLSQLASEMINGCFRDGIPTLGEVVLQAKRRIWEPDDLPANAAEDAGASSSALKPGSTPVLPTIDSSATAAKTNSSPPPRIDIRQRYRKIITEMALALSPGEHDLLSERREHVRLMNLLGDPLLRIPYPNHLPLQSMTTVAPGQPMLLHGESPIGGNLRVELSLVRDRLPGDVSAVANYDGSSDQHQHMQRCYERSNQLVVASHDSSISPGPFQVEIDVPADLKGRCVVSAYVYGPSQWAVGSKRVVVRPAPR